MGTRAWNLLENPLTICSQEVELLCIFLSGSKSNQVSSIWGNFYLNEGLSFARELHGWLVPVQVISFRVSRGFI
jgi:hypothetical protein